VLAQSTAVGGFSIAATSASGVIRFYSGGTTSRAELGTTGLLTLKANLATYGLEGDGTNGLGIAATNASGALRFYTGGATERMTLSTAGALTVTGNINATSGTFRNVTIFDSNNNIVLSSGGGIPALSQIVLSPNGTLSGAGGGQVTLPGMGQNTFRVVAAGFSASR
jgi:hypothetical protein